MTPALAELIGWAQRSLTIQTQANADTGKDVRTAKELGASGVGLCRLEHVLAAAEEPSNSGRPSRGGTLSVLRA